MTENPYTATPTTFAHAIPESEVVQTSLLAIARGVFLAWEKLRIAYVIILALITVLAQNCPEIIGDIVVEHRRNEIIPVLALTAVEPTAGGIADENCREVLISLADAKRGE